MNLEKEVFEINLNDLIPNRFQPREIFNDEELKELSDSIKQHGVIQPIIVRKVGDKYEIIAGERRFRASRLAGKTTIPALVRDIDDREAAKIALLENLQRSNLTSIEEAKTYQTILKIDNITQEELAVSLGKSQGTIANKLRLLTLNEDVQTALLNSQISERHARSLLSLSTSEQGKMLQRIIKEKMTVRQLDEEIKKITGKDPEQIIEEPMQSPVIQQEQPAINTNNVLSDIQNVIEPNQQKTIEPKVPEDITITNDMQVNEKQEQPEDIFKKPINNDQEKTNDQNLESAERPLNIFDKLRIPSEERQVDNFSEQTAINAVEEASQVNLNEVYDLRFAINNFRQAVQNTEKFGFKVKSSEYDSPNKYQFVIEIDKN